MHEAGNTQSVVGARNESPLTKRWLSPAKREATVALDEALTKLTAIDPRKGKVVELRFFGGLSVEETAEALKISAVTVMREWSMAKAWLYNSLNNET